MIGKVLPMWKGPSASTARSGRQLMCYLLGKGHIDEQRAAAAGGKGIGEEGNLHSEPRVIAGWDATRAWAWRLVCRHVDWSQPDLAWTQLRGHAVAIARQLTAAAPEADADLGVNALWHTTVVAHPDDGDLSDDTWQAIAKRVMAETKLDAGDGNPCRWVAVRHGRNDAGADHIHIAAVLVREDGRRASRHNDFFAVQRACRWAEQEYGLTVGRGRTLPDQERVADTTRTKARRGDYAEGRRWRAAHGPGPGFDRGDYPKGHPLAEADTVLGRTRIAVRMATARAWDIEHMMRLLDDQGFTIRFRYSEANPGQRTGWSLLPPASVRAGSRMRGPITGGRLGPDCTWPALERHFQSLAAGRGSGVIADEEGRGMLTTERMTGAGWGMDFIARVVSLDHALADGQASSAEALWLRDAFWQVAWEQEGDRGGPWTDAAYCYAAMAALPRTSAPPPAWVDAKLEETQQWYIQAQRALNELVGGARARDAERDQLDAEWDHLQDTVRRVPPAPPIDAYPIGVPGAGAARRAALATINMATSAAEVRAHTTRADAAQARMDAINRRRRELKAAADQAHAEAHDFRQLIRDVKDSEATLLRWQHEHQQWRAAIGRLLADAQGEADATTRIRSIDRRHRDASSARLA